MFSTSVEMILASAVFILIWKGVLYECGDDPVFMLMWNFGNVVFSTSVEMILRFSIRVVISIGVLYECGDDP